MAKDILPRADSELVQWLRRFSARLNEAPESFGVSPELAEELAELYQQFDEAYRASVDPATRGRLSVARKNACREHVKREARILARCVQNRMETTDAQRVILGLTVASGGAPIGRPEAPPTMEIVSADGWSVVVQLRPAGSISRGMPKGTVQAFVGYFAGSQPPASLKEWKHLRCTSRARFKIDLPTSLPAGTRVFLTARWATRRGLTGPSCAAASILLGGGVPQTPAIATLRRAA